MAYATKKKLSDNSIVPLGSNLYGTCSTASGTAQKTVSMPDFDVLVEGVTIHVYFSNKNTASSPTLKVGSTDAKPIRYNGQDDGSWDDGGFISFTYYNNAWYQNDITIGGVTYTFSISGHTMTISGSDGSTQTVTLPDDNVTYTLTKSGSNIKLTGSDGSEASVVDNDTWKANSASNEGYVASGNGQLKKVWGTDESGNPGWQEQNIYHYKSFAGVSLPDSTWTPLTSFTLPAGIYIISARAIFGQTSTPNTATYRAIRLWNEDLGIDFQQQSSRNANGNSVHHSCCTVLVLSSSQTIRVDGHTGKPSTADGFLCAVRLSPYYTTASV